MKRFQGKGVYSAVAVGKVSLFEKADAAVKHVRITEIAAEKARYEKAKTIAVRQLDEIYNKALREVGEADAAIFEIHQMMLGDDNYDDAILRIIEDEAVAAGYGAWLLYTAAAAAE